MKTPLDQLTTADLTTILKDLYKQLDEARHVALTKSQTRTIEKSIDEFENLLKSRHRANNLSEH